MPHSDRAAPALTAEELRQRLSYDPETGAFQWLLRNPKYRTQQAARVGRLTHQGYLQIAVNRRAYMGHRLAWLHVTGHWPLGVIDHINGDKADNRFVNLRDVSISLNTQNQRRPHSRSTTGYLGVCFNKQSNKFQASIYFDKKLRHLGLFETAEQASAAYLVAKRTHHEGNTL